MFCQFDQNDFAENQKHPIRFLTPNDYDFRPSKAKRCGLGLKWNKLLRAKKRCPISRKVKIGNVKSVAIRSQRLGFGEENVESNFKLLNTSLLFFEFIICPQITP
jgi:hypothetical protein